MTTTPETSGHLWYHADCEDSESWFGACATREEAIEDGKDEYDGSFFVCRASNPPLRLADWINADDVLERADEQIADSDRVGGEWDEGPWFEASPEQAADLAARLREACDDWQAAHGLVFTCRTLADISTPELVTIEPEEEE